MAFNQKEEDLTTRDTMEDVPTEVDTVSYANADLTSSIKVLEHSGVRLLTADETQMEMPEYPL